MDTKKKVRVLINVISEAHPEDYLPESKLQLLESTLLKALRIVTGQE